MGNAHTLSSNNYEESQTQNSYYTLKIIVSLITTEQRWWFHPSLGSRRWDKTFDINPQSERKDSKDLGSETDL